MKSFVAVSVIALVMLSVASCEGASAGTSSFMLARKVQNLHRSLSEKAISTINDDKKTKGRSMKAQQLPGDDGVGDGAAPENPQQSFDISDFNFQDPKCALAITTWSTVVSMDCTTQQLADFGKDAYTDKEANDFFEKFATTKCAEAMGKKFADLGTHCIGATAEVAARMVEASVTRGADGKLCGVEFQRVSRYQNCNNATNSSECVKMQGCAVAEEFVRQGAEAYAAGEGGNAPIPPPPPAAADGAATVSSGAKFECDAKAEAKSALCSSSCLKKFIEKNSDLIDKLQSQKMFRELKQAGKLCDPAEAPFLLSTTAAPFALTESPDETAVAPGVTAPQVTFDFGDGTGDGAPLTTHAPNSNGGHKKKNHHQGHNNNNHNGGNQHHRHNNNHTKKKHFDDLGAQNSVAPNPLAPSVTSSKPQHHSSGGSRHHRKSGSANSSSSSSTSVKGTAVGVLGIMFVMALVVIAVLLHQKRQRFNRRRRAGGFSNPNDDIDIESDVDDLDYGNEPATAAAATDGDGTRSAAGQVQVGQIVMDDGTVASLPAVLANPGGVAPVPAVAPAPPVTIPSSGSSGASAPTRFDDPSVRPSMPESPVISDGV